jgi:hypothetical protein
MQMASNEQQPTGRRSAPIWTLPAVSVVLGLIMWAAAWIGGHPMLGLAMFGIMVAFGGTVLASAVIVAFVWEIAHGRSGEPYAPLGAIAGVSYLAAVVWLRWRS